MQHKNQQKQTPIFRNCDDFWFLLFNDKRNIYYKKSPVEGRGNLMFSQRNNPYCELLQIS